MPEPSTTATDANDDANTSTTDDTTTTATDNKTADDSNNLDASKSDDTTVVADDDKKSDDKTTKSDDTLASFDNDLDEWATKRGFPKATTDTEKQAYQDQRNQQREFTREQQAKKDADDLSKEVAKAKSGLPQDEDDELDPLEKRQNAIEAQMKSERETRLQSEFFINEKVSTEEGKMIVAVMSEKFNRPTTEEGKRRALETWSDPDALPDLLDIARSRIAKTVDTSAITEEAARKERERIARESNAKSPNRSATVADNDSNKTQDQERLERFKARYNKS